MQARIVTLVQHPAFRFVKPHITDVQTHHEQGTGFDGGSRRADRSRDVGGVAECKVVLEALAEIRMRYPNVFVAFHAPDVGG